MEFNRLFGIVELRIAREEDELRQNPLIACVLCHRDPIHARHTDVRQEDVGMRRTQQLQPSRTVGGITDDNAVHRRPVNGTYQPLADDLLILDNQHTLHFAHLRCAESAAPSPHACRPMVGT